MSAETTEQRCGECGYASVAGALVCGMCGRVLRKEAYDEPLHGHTEPSRAEPERAAPVDLPEQFRSRRTAATPDPAAGRVHGLPAPVFYLAAGAVLSPLFGLTPIVRYMGWFLGALCHEMGHVAVSWFFGCPAYPAIRLDGHAAAIHQDQRFSLCVMVWLLVALGAYVARHRKPLLLALIAVLLVYPALAFTQAREFLHLVGGHAGELAFATVCFWRALSGRATGSRPDRVLYAMVGWYLVADNVALTWGLATSLDARRAYGGGGSFGITNDYVRLSDDVLGCELPLLAHVMTLAALAVVPLSIAIWRSTARVAAGRDVTGRGPATP